MEDKVQRPFRTTKDARETADRAWARAAAAIEQAKDEAEMDRVFDDFKLQVKQLRLAGEATRGG